ncbi:hypothetical protein CA267_013375 [Alteromonas pelagimontana]|uniref:Lipoprotein n=1 Tax=Alteromonas pelagimontana TaxID=1858656 RepID=A0A6M4MHM1_9ALTE|nr:hypothetical protein [Alteromonas pelagimontana]QJR81686.1 hypothetical protein CA267_013375 [Alteromonas pelagimontana]
MKRCLASIIPVILLSGCVSTSDLTGSTGTSNSPLYTNLQQHNLDGAISFAQTESGFDPEKKSVDDQLWAMQAGLLYRMKGDFASSTNYFDMIEDVMYSEDTENVLESGGEQIGSMLTNDTFLDYEQTLYDAVMVNTYKAINFEALGDIANARVEWNRSDDRQRRAAEFFAKQINKSKEELENQKDDEDAEASDIDKSVASANDLLAQQGIDMSGWKAYDGYVNPFSTFMHGLFFLRHANDAADIEKAIDSFERVVALTGSLAAKDTLDYAKSLRANPTAQNDYLWVIIENGEATQKEAFEINLPLYLVSSNINYAGVALPKLKEREETLGVFSVNDIQATSVADMDRIIQADFKDKFPLILTREITRTAIKTVAQKQINDHNPLLGLAAGFVQGLSTEADTRSWSLLPKNFQAVMLPRPADGRVKIAAEHLTTPLEVELTEPNAGVVYVKAMNPLVTPTIHLM